MASYTELYQVQAAYFSTHTLDRAAALDLARSLQEGADDAAVAGNAADAVGLATEAHYVQDLCLGTPSEQDTQARARRLVALRERANR